VHPIDSPLLEGVWNQFENREVAAGGAVISPGGGFPRLPDLARGGGFTIEMWLRLTELSAGQVLLDTTSPSGQGIVVRTTDRFTLGIDLHDGSTRAFWDSDPGTHEGTLRTGAWQHVVFVVDGGPKIITVIVDGVLNDGGAVREYGWGRFPPALGDVNGSRTPRVAPRLFGSIRELKVYERSLRTSEAVGNYRAGLNG
jgi:hypothetical protein